MKILFVMLKIVLVLQLAILFVLPGRAAELLVTIKGDPASPDEVMALVGSAVVQGSYDQVSKSYKVSVSDEILSGTQGVSTILAVWGNRNETLCVQLEPKVTEIRMYHREMPANLDTIRTLERRGADLISTLETYFDSREVWWTFVDRGQGNHWLAVAAAHIWYSAAVRLTQFPNTIFCMDQEAEKTIKRYDDPPQIAYMRDLLKEIRNPDVVKEALASAGSWEAVGVVRRLIAKGDFVTADFLNRTTLQKFEKASKDERAAVRQEYGVDLGDLKAFQSQITAGLQAHGA